MDLLLTNCRLHSESSDIYRIQISDGIIQSVTTDITHPGDRFTIIDINNRLVTPGLIDIHIQGAGGADVLDGSEQALVRISKTLAAIGVTGFLATTVVHLNKDNDHIKIAAQYCGKSLGGATLLGVHLEGPFINPERRGGIAPDNIGLPSHSRLQKILEITGPALKIMTIAPELDGTEPVIQQLRKRNIIASFGHSNASYEQTKNSFTWGINHVTHLFNAMPGIHHRAPGPVIAILEEENVTCQIIADGVHLNSSIIKLIYGLLGRDRCICITDGVQAIGLPDGTYYYNGKEYRARRGIARYKDGTLIGSAVGLDQIMFRFMTYTNCPFDVALAASSLNPAKLLGIDEQKGSIAAGKDADLVIWDNNSSVLMTIIDGKIVYRKSI